MSRRSLFNFVFIFLVLALPSYYLAPPSPLYDLPEFYSSGRMVLAGQGAEIYQPEKLKLAEWSDFPELKNGERFIALYAIPPAVPLLLAAGFIPPALIPYVWWFASLSAVTASMGLAAATFGISEKVMLRFAALLVAFGPLWETIKHSQIAGFVLLGLCGALWCLRRRKTIPAMLLLAVVLVLKPQIFLPLFLFLLGAYGVIGTLPFAAGGMAVLSVLSLSLIGIAGYRNYIQLAKNSLQNRQMMAPEAGPTLRGQMLRVFPQADAMVVNVSTIVALLASWPFFFLGRRLKNDPLCLERGVIGAIPVGMVVALHCHSYDLLLLLPSFMALVAYHRQQPLSKGIVCALIASLLLYMMPIYVKVHYGYLLMGAVWNPFFFALLVFSGICLWLSWKKEP